MSLGSSTAGLGINTGVAAGREIDVALSMSPALVGAESVPVGVAVVSTTEDPSGVVVATGVFVVGKVAVRVGVTVSEELE